VLARVDDRDPPAHRIQVPAQGRHPRRAVRGHRARGDPGAAQRPQPLRRRGDLARVGAGVPVRGDEGDGPCGVAGGERVADRPAQRSGPLLPQAGTLVQAGDDPRVRPRELVEQHLPEQPVVAVPKALAVQRHDEQVVALQPLDDLGRVARACHRAAQGRGELGEDRGACKEAPDGCRLRREDLLTEVVGDVAVPAPEGADEAGRGGVAAQGERREIDRRGPSFRPLGQRGQFLAGQRGAGDGGHHGRHLP
jgi:hypothetical protein